MTKLVRKNPRADHILMHDMGGLCRQITLPTMEVLHYGQLYIAHTVLYLHQLCVLSLVDSRLPRYDHTHILLHPASHSCCFRCYRPFFTVCPGSKCQWLHLQHRGGLRGVGVVGRSQRMAYRVTRPLFSWIPIRSHFVDVFVEQ